MLVALKPGARVHGEELKERLRARLSHELPDTTFSFEAGYIVSQVMSFGSPTPIEVAVQGLNVAANRAFADKIRAQLQKVPSLRDLGYAQPLDYPTVNVNINRDRAGQLGLTVASVAKSLVAATSSSRFTEPNFWRDPASGNGFQIQVEIPQSRMPSIADIQNLPVLAGNSQTLLGDLAEVKDGTTAGAVDRYHMQRLGSLTAHNHGQNLSDAAADVDAAI